MTRTVLGAALPALAAPTCTAPQVVSGKQLHTLNVHGLGRRRPGDPSVVTLYVPPNVSGPIDFEVTALSSSLGSACTGYFGIEAGELGQPGARSLRFRT